MNHATIIVAVLAVAGFLFLDVPRALADARVPLGPGSVISAVVFVVLVCMIRFYDPEE